MPHLRTQLAGLAGGREILAAAADCPDKVFLVGGAVRDLLLGRIPSELDVSVEGAIDRLLQRLPGEHERHARFGTATVRHAGWTVDLAACRRERYATPGALPDVEPADIKTDLLRRDLTINAMAVDLGDGSLIEVPGALADLRAQSLRVLHDASFLDDPTRLWRLVRYQARLGFSIDPTTAALARGALAAGAMESISGARTGDELRLCAAEADPVAALEAAQALGLAPWLAFDAAATTAVLDRAAHVAPDANRMLVVLIGALKDPTLAMLDGLAFRADERDVIMRSAGACPRDVARDARPSAIADAFVGEPVESVLWSPAIREADQWLSTLRHRRLAITGDDLKAAGCTEGPLLGAALRATFHAMVDGDLPNDHGAQLRWALTFFADAETGVQA